MADSRNWTQLPDRELVRRATHPADGDERAAAFAEIYRRHHRAVLAVCAHYLTDEPGAAEDAAQETFADLIKTLRKGTDPLQEPDMLRAWLRTCAQRRCYKIVRGRRLTRPLSDDLPDDPGEDRGSQARLAEVNRIIAAVVASLTPWEQTIFELYTRQGIRGKRLAVLLGKTANGASKTGSAVRETVKDGFGVYVLASEGRPYCPKLAKILDRHAWSGSNFTAPLRQRIIRHMGTCITCGNCLTCRGRVDAIKRSYAPALIPVLAAPGLYDRVMESIDRDKRGRWAKRPLPPPPPLPPSDEAAEAQPASFTPAAKGGAWGGGLLAMLLLRGAITYNNNQKNQAAAGDFANKGQQTLSTPYLTVDMPNSLVGVWSDPGGIDCGQASSACGYGFTSGTQVTLTANVPPDLMPAQWMGCDFDPGDASQPCTVTMTYDRAVCVVSVFDGMDAVEYCRQVVGG